MAHVSIGRLFKAAWAQIALAFISGILLTFVPKGKWYSALHEIGIGLIVAAFVTLFWHLRELSELFGRFARDVLLEDEYLSKLSVKSLTTLRSKAARAILASCADNPRYERGALGDWIDDLMFNHLLPGKTPLSGMYRENYEEKILTEYPTLEEALTQVGADTVMVPAERRLERVLKVTETAWYTVIPPGKNDQEYEFTYGGKAADMSHFPLSKRVQLYVGSAEANAKEVPLHITKNPNGGVAYKLPDRKLLRITDGKCKVWLRVVEYRTPLSETHILNTMSVPTRNLKVDLYQVGAGPKLMFSGDVIATGPDREVRRVPNGISLDFKGWLFEDHGYFLWWWEEA